MERKYSLSYARDPLFRFVDTYFASHCDMNSLLPQSVMLTDYAQRERWLCQDNSMMIEEEMRKQFKGDFVQWSGSTV